MSGRWTRIYDGDRWIDVYIDNWPVQIHGSLATPLPGSQKPVLLGPDGKPVTGPPRRRIGFGS
jgi:hypothetical protein